MINYHKNTIQSSCKHKYFLIAANELSFFFIEVTTSCIWLRLNIGVVFHNISYGQEIKIETMGEEYSSSKIVTRL